MIKFLKIYRGFKLLILNAIHFRLILVGLKLSFLLFINIFTKFLFLKFKNKNITNDFFNHTKKFRLSQNYFKHNPAIWYEIFKKNNLLNKDINILEIGSFEGMSVLFFDKYLKVKNLYSVDLQKNNNFIYNIRNLKNINFFNMKSDDFFKKKLDIDFDIIYVDGSHYSIDVFNDLINSDLLLKKGGILIIDDLLLDFSIRKKGYKFYEEVMGGIFLFLKEKVNYKFLYTGHQLIIKKI
jgi:hypothetical protein